MPPPENGKTGERLRAFTGFAYGCQFLYGGWFLFHGLNYWFEFYPDRSIQPGPGLVPAIAAAGLMAVVKALEVGIGVALLANRFAALAVVAAWPITLMIAFVTASHGKPFGVGVAVIIIALNAIMSLGYLERYRPMLAVHANARLPVPSHALAAIAGFAAAIAITYLSLALRR
ncbi:hypothetical protein [Sphingomonas hengshuiensis]|uniref:DoxX family protein n=1 Tax=Sphingomonas hengshuiensis TaxID=1609977 RepID=A0A7U4LFK4_9SPHN|nr:hypothetical protein [Sphingomonas hengshuiensis]AJP72530.1 hypothetical protein TS85_13220 [Sphingomonas hengshuiensis]